MDRRGEKLQSTPHTIYKINSKWIRGLQREPKTIKLIEKKIGKSLVTFVTFGWAKIT